MKDRVQGCVTAGVALVGAGVMAAAPVAQQAPEVLRSVNADVALAAQPTTYDEPPAELLGITAQRFAESLVSTPLGLIPIAQAVAAGDAGEAALYALLKEYIDGPLYVADPAIYALDDLLPAPLGGDEDNYAGERGDSIITQFRSDVLYQSRQEMNKALLDTLGLPNTTDTNGFDDGVVYKASRLGFGLADSALRAAKSAVVAPLGLVAVAEGLQKSLNGEGNTDLYLALQSYIDAPNYVADPIVFAADDVLPAPTGGDPEKDPRFMDNSEITRLRGNVLLAPRNAVREAVAGPLGVDPIDGHELNPNFAGQLNKSGSNETISQTKEPKGPLSQIKESLKAIPGASNETARKTGGAHRLESTGGLGSLFKKREKAPSTS